MGFTAAIGQRVRRIRPIWIWIAVSAGLLEVAFGYLSLHPHPFEKVSERAARLTRTYGIVIGYGHPSTFFVPPYGPADAEIDDMQMIGADLQSLAPALDGIEESLAMYPLGFVSSLVRAIFVAGELRVGSERAGGSTGPAWFILAASDSSDAWAIRLNNLVGVHHELSSFVLQKADAMEEWTAFTPVDWKFTTTSEEALTHGSAPDPGQETGFLSAYGATTAENDFNTYAERIFTEPKPLVQLACQHALIRKKLLFVLRTYIRLDARMENVFRELGIDGVHLCKGQSRWPW
jgi:hypothetical protein